MIVKLVGWRVWPGCCSSPCSVGFWLLLSVFYGMFISFPWSLEKAGYDQNWCHHRVIERVSGQILWLESRLLHNESAGVNLGALLNPKSASSYIRVNMTIFFYALASINICSFGEKLGELWHQDRRSFFLLRTFFFVVHTYTCRSYTPSDWIDQRLNSY